MHAYILGGCSRAKAETRMWGHVSHGGRTLQEKLLKEEVSRREQEKDQSKTVVTGRALAWLDPWRYGSQQ